MWGCRYFPIDPIKNHNQKNRKFLGTRFCKFDMNHHTVLSKLSLTAEFRSEGLEKILCVLNSHFMPFTPTRLIEKPSAAVDAEKVQFPESIEVNYFSFPCASLPPCILPLSALPSASRRRVLPAQNPWKPVYPALPRNLSQPSLPPLSPPACSGQS